MRIRGTLTPDGNGSFDVDLYTEDGNGTPQIPPGPLQTWTMPSFTVTKDSPFQDLIIPMDRTSHSWEIEFSWRPGESPAPKLSQLLWFVEWDGSGKGRNRNMLGYVITEQRNKFIFRSGINTSQQDKTRAVCAVKVEDRVYHIKYSVDLITMKMKLLIDDKEFKSDVAGESGPFAGDLYLTRGFDFSDSEIELPWIGAWFGDASIRMIG